MDGDSLHFGAEQLEAVFERGDLLVYLMHEQIVGQSAVA
jgi:hypothetical protein